MFNNKTILITGGTGSFGKEFLEFVIKNYKPKKFIIYSRDEYKQFKVNEKFPDTKYKFLRFFLGDVRDQERLKSAMRGVDYVIHAAALKHVPAAEYNPIEFVKTNIYGAENVIQAAISQKVEKVIALSTDKAANPINLYGATKLASDKIFIAANNIKGRQSTSFSIVRYGNVAGSRGSVLPLFKNLSEKKEKFFPVTDKEMTRFWITLNQSIKFVVKCFSRMSGGETFVPKIPSVKVTDIAKAIDQKMKIKVVGIRPGEKIHELMCPNESSHVTLEFKDHYVICPLSLDSFGVKNYLVNKIGEKGKKVPTGFEYSSNKNKFLSVSEIRNLNKKILDDTV